MELLLEKVIECVAAEDLRSKDYTSMTLVIRELLEERKNLLWGIKSQAITPHEAASAILGHLYTENNGYFNTNKLVNFSVEQELAKVLAEAT